MDTAIKLYTLSAALGCGPVQYKLSVMYAEGKDVRQKFKTAAIWFKLAAKPSGTKFPYADRDNVTSKRMQQYLAPSQNLSGKFL